MSVESFFKRDGERFRPTIHAASPWEPAHQAGGAPAALIAMLIDQQGHQKLRAARASVDILSPIPMRPGRVHLETVRQGRATEFITGAWEADNQQVLRVGVWRLAAAPQLPASSLTLTAQPDDEPEPQPEELSDHVLPSALFAPTGYAAAMQWRIVHGAFDRPGPAAAWTRPRVPLLVDTPIPSISRLLLASATANGLGSALDLTRYLAIDVDITVHLERELTEDWVRLDAATHVAEGRTGHVTATFADRDGRVGRGVQTLFVAARRPRPPQRPSATGQRT